MYQKKMQKRLKTLVSTSPPMGRVQPSDQPLPIMSFPYEQGQSKVPSDTVVYLERYLF